MNKIFVIDNRRILATDGETPHSCRECCYDTPDGCIMPSKHAAILSSYCAIEDIIYKDVTDEQGDSNKKVDA